MTYKRQLPFAAYALLIALAVLFFCTKSSPAYPINDWADANIYLTIGKGMTQGRVVYRDLYDHKGPLLYGLHALCALISFSDFTGVFVMEALFAAAFLYQVYRVLRLYGAQKAAWVLLPLTALLVYTSRSFAEGDSAEETALPLAAATLYGVLAHLRGGEKRMARGSLLLHGALAGCVFWIKFTMIGLHAGLLGWVLARHALRRQWRELAASVGWLAAGFGLSTVPWVIYFGLNGAIGDWLKVYLYDNLFLYGGDGGTLLARLKAMAVCGLDWLLANLRYTLPMLAGLVWFSIRHPRERAAVWLMAGLGALATFVGGKSYPYYGLVLAVCLLPFLAALAPHIRPNRAVCALCAAACVALCPFLSRNVRPTEGVALGQPCEESMQYQLAAEIPEGASLLNYGFMDAGFFTAAGLVPEVKYFHQTNVPLQEMLDEQVRYIAEGLCDYVVTRGKQPEEMALHYELVAEADSPNFWYEKAYLYRKKGI